MRRALLIGINNHANVPGLHGCVNDVEDIAALLVEVGGVPAGSLQWLVDCRATRAAITACRPWETAKDGHASGLLAAPGK